MNRLSLLVLLFAATAGCSGAEPDKSELGILVSWDASIDKPLPCVIVSSDSSAETLKAIGERERDCGGPRAFIVYSASEEHLSQILSILPATRSNTVEGRPWHLILLNKDGAEAARLSVGEALELFKGVANASPELREEIEFRLIGRMEAMLQLETRVNSGR